MKPFFVAALLAAACGAAQASPGPAPVYANGKVYAIVSVDRHVSEASNAGGEHYLLTVDHAAPRDPHVAHFGAHASFVALFGGDRFVAEIEPHKPSIIDGGWGLGALAKADSEAVRLLEITDDADGATKLAQIAKAGWPADPDLTLSVGAPSDRTIAIAHGETRDGKLVLVVDEMPPIAFIMYQTEISKGTVLDAPSGVTAGSTFVVVVRSPVRNSKRPAFHVLRTIATTKAKAADVARAMTMPGM